MCRLNRTTLLLIAAIIMSVMALLDYRWREPQNSVSPETIETTRPGSVPASSGPEKDARTTAKLGLHPLAGLRVDDLTDTVARPLFEPSRRPTKISATTAPLLVPTAALPSVDTTMSFRLLGTILGEGRATAVVTAPGRPQALRLEEGDSIDAWTVEKISRDEILLVKSGRRQLLRMARRTK